MFCRSAMVVFVLSLVLSCVSIASANPYVVTDIGVLPGDTTSYAEAVNDSGQVAGSSSYYVSDTSFASHAVLYSGGG